MKKTFNINLAGYPFTIDEDAYNLLKDYLDTIRYAFDTKDDSAEIASDIEARIAELLIESEKGEIRIVTLSEVSNVIERIGKPEEILEIEETSKTIDEGVSEKETEKVEIKETVTPPPFTQSNNYSSGIKKKFFRDPQNSMLGGVCSGLAAYFNIDPTIIRLITVVLFFLSASTVAIAYIVLWIVMPEARTPYERMQMYGKEPSVENIGKTVTENFQENSEIYQADDNKNKPGRFLSNLFSIIVKCGMILCLLIGLPVLLALLSILIICILAFFVAGSALIGGTTLNNLLDISGAGAELLPFYLLLASVGALITIGIPFYLFIRMLSKKNTTNLSVNNRRSLLVIWLIGIALTAVFTVKTVKAAKKLDIQHKAVELYVDTDTEFKINDEELSELKINDEGIKMKTKNGNSLKISDEGIVIEKEKNGNQIIEETVLESIENPDSLKSNNQIIAADSIK